MGKKESSPLAKERAQRIKDMRKALRLSRKKFCEKYKKIGITASSLQSWEEVRWNGLTEKGAHLLCQAFQEEGIHVTLEWLLFGVGTDPLAEVFRYYIPAEITKPVEKNPIPNELRLFQQHHTDVIDTIISDDNFTPLLEIGDRVAGTRYFDQDMEKAIDRLCIVQTLAGEQFICILQSGKQQGRYTLACINPTTNMMFNFLENVELFSVAPILWIRKPELPTKPTPKPQEKISFMV